MPLNFKKKQATPPPAPTKRPGALGLTLEDKEKKARCYDLFLFDFTLQEIAKIEDVNYMRLAKWSSLGKWPARKAEVQALRTKRLPKREQTPMVRAITGEGGKDTIIARVKSRRERIADKVSEHIDEKMTAEEIIAKADKVDTAMKLAERGAGLDKDEGGKSALISLTFLTQNPEQSVRIIDTTPKQLTDQDEN